MTNSPAVSILVVDDQADLLRMMQTFLERQGYSVEPCADAATALAKFKGSPGRWTVVIADVNLPDRQGDEMAFEMAKENPEVRVLLYSGYPYDLEVIPADIRPRFAALQKPFSPPSLTSAVAELAGRPV